MDKKVIIDWELTEDFYKQEEGAETISITDFMDREDTALEKENTDIELKKAAADVKKVMELAAKGNNVDQISTLSGLDREYVYNIQVCAQGFQEDDEIAIAHLILMG